MENRKIEGGNIERKKEKEISKRKVFRQTIIII
jgi:hypothetical protein